MKKMINVLYSVIGVVIAIWLGYGIHDYILRNRYKDIYAVNSAPWYTASLVRLIFVIFIIVICIGAISIIKLKKINKE